jgi:hypothetical protein
LDKTWCFCVFGLFRKKGKGAPASCGDAQSCFVGRRPTLPGCGPSTIGAAGLDCPVRDGKGYFPRAIAALSFFMGRGRDVASGSRLVDKWSGREKRAVAVATPCAVPLREGDMYLFQKKRKNGSFRAISTARLNASPRLHLPPINVVVSHGPSWNAHLWDGFALRCFQRLSFPRIATRHCSWRNNRYTSGASTPVLSY